MLNRIQKLIWISSCFSPSIIIFAIKWFDEGHPFQIGLLILVFGIFSFVSSFILIKVSNRKLSKLLITIDSITTIDTKDFIALLLLVISCISPILSVNINWSWEIVFIVVFLVIILVYIISPVVPVNVFIMIKYKYYHISINGISGILLSRRIIRSAKSQLKVVRPFEFFYIDSSIRNKEKNYV